MEHLVASVRKAIASKNWYSALALSLALPDICGRIETPNVASGKRYARWWCDNVQSQFTSEIGPDRRVHVFLGGNDAYALRCAFLHEGQDDINAQRAQAILTRFLFVEPPESGLVHLNQFGTVLQLQVDLFCEAVAASAETWAKLIERPMPAGLLLIRDARGGISF